MSKKKRGPTGQTIGAIIVGFDQQIFRTLPPAQELVVKAKPERGLSGQAPGLEVVFPDDVVIDAGGAIADVGPGNGVGAGRRRPGQMRGL